MPVVPRAVGQSVLGSSRATPCPWDGWHHGGGDLQRRCLVEAGTAYVNGQRQEGWGSCGDLGCRVKDMSRVEIALGGQEC